MQKKQPLISLFIISASIQCFFPLIERDIWRTPTSLGPMQLCLQQSCNIRPLCTDRQLSKRLCRAEEKAVIAKLGSWIFLLSGHQEHLFSSKSPTSVVGKRYSFILLCCFESLANLGLCDLATSSNTALSTQNTHQNQCLK